MKVTIDKELLDKLLASIEPVESNWLDNVPGKHRKFAAYWDELGKPQLEFIKLGNFLWKKVVGTPCFDKRLDYRIQDDPHWELRLKWVNSDKTLPIEYFEPSCGKWLKDGNPEFSDHFQYREAKPWYEQEISREKPIFLRHKLIKPSLFYTFSEIPPDKDNWIPLTDQEIDELKRGF